MKLLLICSLAFTINACTSSGSDSFDFSGVWKGSLSKKQITCQGEASGVSVENNVNQMGNKIELRSKDIDFNGRTTEGNSFKVTAEREIIITNSGKCNAEYEYVYANAKSNSADVTFTTSITCDDGSNCVASYAGSLTRNK